MRARDEFDAVAEADDGRWIGVESKLGLGSMDAAAVNLLRISRACHLLASTDLPVSQIQYECGYANSSNFHRRFLEEIGMTPSEYRRTCGS
jgi:transcriptional regulator GlxA family with amidase domain